jgi:single-stranded-DNA-specific exonuclease
MGAGGNAGLVALGTAAGAKGPPDTYTAGFILGPRLNAGGRIGISDWGAKLLATDDPAQIAELSATLNRINVDRQEIEGEVLASAEARLVDTGAPLLFIAGENWHAGVIGIVASRLREKYHRPAIVIGVEKGIGKGSGRSMDGVDLGSAVIAAKQAGLLIAGGGHKMAAGLTVAAEKMAALREFLIARIGAQMEAEPLKPSLTLDGIVAAPALNGDFMEKLSTLQPFGTGNPEPRFALPDCRIVNAKIVGEKHVSIVAKQGGDRVRGIAFRAMDTALGPALLAAGEKVHLAGKIRPDDWRGNGAVQLIVEDAGG